MISYCSKWSRFQKRPIQIWDVKRAEFAYAHRSLHVVLIGDPQKPEVFIEFNHDYVGVGFLDDNLREYLTYQFREVEPGRLFLTMATHREFDGSSDRVQSGKSYVFEQNG